jgi:penicillin G amidase
MTPAPGWTDEYEWIGEVPFEEIPHALNPAKGFVANCNNRIVDDDYPYFLGSVYMNGYRLRRLTEMILAQDKLGPDDFRAMQTDLTCLPGQEFVICLQDFTSNDSDVQLALELLRAWDGQLSTDTIGGTVYEVARYTLIRCILEPALGKEGADAIMGTAFNPVLYADHEFYGNDTQVLLRLLGQPDSWWLQQAGGRQELLEIGLKLTVEYLRQELGEQPEAWRWGRMHHIRFGHAMGSQPPLDKVFNRGPFPVGGDTDTPWQTAMAPDDPYDNKLWSPSMRHILDLGDWSRSRFVLPVGNSGHLGSAHYDDLLPLWLNGEYRPLLWTRPQIEAELEGKLTLKAINPDSAPTTLIP